jgi:hypothetical protein
MQLINVLQICTHWINRNHLSKARSIASELCTASFKEHNLDSVPYSRVQPCLVRYSLHQYRHTMTLYMKFLHVGIV